MASLEPQVTKGIQNSFGITMFQPVNRCFCSRKWKITNEFHPLNERHYSHDWKIPHTHTLAKSRVIK